ncbi:MAG: hypothetical protein ACREVY_14170 [Gammaproteobacteria bacterium]
MNKNGLTGAQTLARVIQRLVLERSGQGNIMRTRPREAGIGLPNAMGTRTGGLRVCSGLVS